MTVLADTTVWSRHFRERDERLASALMAGGVTIHPWIVGELALGPGLRLSVLEDLERLPALEPTPDREVLDFVKLHRVRGIGWVDAQVLLTSLRARVELWTDDRALADLWLRFRAG